ncbi:ThiF family adenylyltransferase [Eubacteriales bacterium KG127]
MGINERWSRTRMLVGNEGIVKLTKASVAVFGLGGVGGAVVEALARAGVGHLTLIDNDVVDESNINRQIIANYDTLGKYKVEVCKARVLSVNPECSVDIFKQFILPGDFGDIGDFKNFDFVVDAIDTVSGKIAIIERAKEASVKVISAMGAGNKLDSSKFLIDDISKTKVCPLAKVMRRKLRQLGITKVDALYSTEESIKTGNSTPGSISYVTNVAGLMIGGHVIRNLLNL